MASSAAPLLAQQFMKPGPNNKREADEQSKSLGEDEEPSASPSNNAKRKLVVHEGESEQPNSPSWASNKSPIVPPGQQQASSSATDQVSELPCRKARVSVRARSDAPMVTKTLRI